MTIFKKESKNKDSKMIGAIVLPHIHQYLTLYILAKSSSKSQLLITIIENWMMQTRQEEPDDVLIRELASRLNERWEQEKESMTFERFKDLAKQEMEEKDLKPQYVTMVINQLKP